VLQSGKPVITFWGDEQLADLDSAPHTWQSGGCSPTNQRQTAQEPFPLRRHPLSRAPASCAGANALLLSAAPLSSRPRDRAFEIVGVTILPCWENVNP